MNHRCCKRYAVSIPAQLSTQEKCSQPVTVTNLSSGGAFVETDFPAAYPVDSIVDLQLLAQDQTGTSGFHTHGMVIHQGTNGLGIMFTTEEPVGLNTIWMRPQEVPLGCKSLDGN
jgi:hypothetical protein